MTDGDVDDAGHAVAMAAAATAWRESPARERAEILVSTFELILRDTEEPAELVSAESGESIADARTEVAHAAEFFRWYAEECVRTAGAYGPSPEGGARTIVTQHPVGVAALVTPWNFPAVMVARKVAPALAAGCTTVLEPVAETPPHRRRHRRAVGGGRRPRGSA